MNEITPDTPYDDLPSFWEAEEVEGMAKGVIKEHHQQRIGQAPITYIFSRKMKDAGKAHARGPKDRIIYEALGVECDFVITLNWQTWVVLSDEQKEALLDHELTHLHYKDVKGELVPTIREHDLEEFVEIIERRGLWNARVKRMSDVMIRTTEPGGNKDD